jgi:hypothetical protein
MNCTAWKEVRFTRANGHSFSIYRKSEHAFNSVHGFIVMLGRCFLADGAPGYLRI